MAARHYGVLKSSRSGGIWCVIHTAAAFADQRVSEYEIVETFTNHTHQRPRLAAYCYANERNAGADPNQAMKVADANGVKKEAA